MPNIICFGEILWDIFHEEDHPRKVLGGAPSNLCYFFNMLGEPAQLISQVGRDHLGSKALDKIVQLKLPHLISQSDIATGKVDITIQNHEPHYIFNDPAAWDSIPFSDKIAAATSDATMIAFGSLAQRKNGDNDSFATLKKILSHNPQAIRFLDLNLRAPHFEESRIIELLKLTDILKINEDEFQYLKQLFALNSLTTRDALYQLLLQLKLNFIILTLGAQGSIVISETNYSAMSIQKVNIMDTVGAGDAFSAAFLSALNRGANFEAAHQFANQFSSYICTQKGAFVEIPASFREYLDQLSAW